ncbi:MAG: RNA-binding domain-containing protein [Cyclobacteriaceae bacterium]
MLTIDEVKSLMNDLESDRVERTISFREDKLGPATCAFSNDFPNHKQPGYILLGVNDDGTVNGMTIGDDDLQKIGNVKSNGNVLPQPSLVVSPVYKIDEGDVVVVEVKPSLYPPVRYDGRCWIRVGARKSKASIEEERMLIEKRSSTAKTFDTQPCLGSAVSDLNTDLFKTFYLPKAIDEETLKENNREIKQQLASLRFYDLAHECPTHAGILLFGEKPTHFVPGAYVQYVKIPGKEIIPGIEFEKVFKKSLCLDLSNIDEFIQSVIIKKSLLQKPDSMQEQIIYNYPLWAIREFVFNAIIHRNYESNAPILIYEFLDRIEIKNPGYLFGQVNKDNFPHLSDYRNLEVAEALKTLGYINKFNFGIATAKKYLRENNNPDPIFDLTLLTAFKVTIPISQNWKNLY